MPVRMLPPRFVTWKPVPNVQTGKIDKVPCDPKTGRDINPHDPASWLTFEEASATGRPVGFILTGDGFFLIDVDKCRSATGEWSDTATRVASLFPGAAMEVSSSGTGLHVLARHMPQLVSGATHKNRLPNGVEFYTDKRMVAFGPYGWQGNPDLDHTAALLAFVPPREAPGQQMQPGTPTGVADDEVIRRLLAAKGGAAAIMGDGPTPADLWHARADVLTRWRPDADGRGFDHSAADGALMNHIAFWCNRDPIQMDRIFRRSGLMRDKYEREDYRQWTLTLGMQTAHVFDWTPDAETQAAVVLGEYLTTPVSGDMEN